MPNSNLFPTKTHNHRACVATAMAEAESLCHERQVRFTSVRKRVLELVWRQHRPSGAYDILDALNENGKNAAPPTVYRALDFLVEHGLVHRIQSLNAYIGCQEPGHHEDGAFLICRNCGVTAELNRADIASPLEQSAKIEGFILESMNLEAMGLCPNCQDEAQ